MLGNPALIGVFASNVNPLISYELWSDTQTDKQSDTITDKQTDKQIEITTLLV